MDPKRSDQFLAHISEDAARVQTVEDHLKGAAQRAGRFGSAFNAEKPAVLAALLHDVGKCSDAFQRHIRGDPCRTDHSTAGAQALRRLGQLDLAFAVAGHHGGLPDGGTPHDTADDTTMMGRFQKKTEDCGRWHELLPELPPVPPQIPWKDRFAQAFYIRMLFSCLVDADYLDTEAFMRGDDPPRSDFEPLTALLQKVRSKAAVWLNAPPGKEIDVIRNRILRACADCGADSAPGLFTLTVPTGGGKTFASLAFALEHAVKNGMDRVIYVIPYTSIIDQTVERFRKILGQDNVLAHYAGADYLCRDAEDLSAAEYRQLLASENWDAPVIVTTAVQFFESLYANRPARCRKLHNITNSVLIFDEAQTLPPAHLRPCAAAMAQLVSRYRASIVLCTATQPALGELFREFAPGVPLREICETGTDLYKKLKRTTLAYLGEITEQALSGRLAEQPQVLCVVNRRKTAQSLYDALPPDGRFCLTTLLTPRDRRRKLADIRRRLAAGEPCRVVSTSLIEAGVDLDFPTAYREETGLDSILQTAGRCNREGTRTAAESVVYIFAPEGSGPPPLLEQNRDLFHAVRRDFPDSLDSPQAIFAYFSGLLYVKGKAALDKEGILEGFAGTMNGQMLPFRQAAERFRLIQNETRSVYIPIGKGEALCARLQRGEVSRLLYRQLGEYAVSVYPPHCQALYAAGALQPLENGGAILRDLSYYSNETGLSLDVEGGQAFFV